MSYELVVVTPKPLSAGTLSGFLDREGLSRTGSFEEGGSTTVTRLSRGRELVVLTLDGPGSTSHHDLPPDLAGLVLAPRWRLGLLLPAAASSADLSLARKLARELAQSGSGAAYDPQQDKCLWPKGKRYQPPAPEERIRLVRLVWFLPSGKKQSPEAPTALLASVARTLPEALPTRFGTREPLKGRLSGGDESAFVEAWAAADSVCHLQWEATPPCFGGAVLPYNPRSADAGVPVVRVTLDLDGRPFVANIWCDALVNLFCDVATELGAFYAAAFVERDVLTVRRRLYWDDRSENYTLQQHPNWVGIPHKPTWLAWFGSPYAALLDEIASSEFIHRLSPGVLFFRLADTPLDLDELKSTFPELPQHLLAMGGRGRLEPAALIPDLEQQMPRDASDGN